MSRRSLMRICRVGSGRFRARSSRSRSRARFRSSESFGFALSIGEKTRRLAKGGREPPQRPNQGGTGRLLQRLRVGHERVDRRAVELVLVAFHLAVRALGAGFDGGLALRVALGRLGQVAGLSGLALAVSSM